MHHIDIYLGKWTNFDQKSKFPWHWTSKIGNFLLKGQEEDHETRKCTKIKALTIDQAVDRIRIDQPVRRGVVLNTLPMPHFFTCFLWFFKGYAISVGHKRFLTTLQHFEGFQFDFWDIRLRFGTASPSTRITADFSSVPARLGFLFNFVFSWLCSVPSLPASFPSFLFL